MKRSTWMGQYAAWRSLAAEAGWSLAQLRGERGEGRQPRDLREVRGDVGEVMWAKFLRRYEREAAD